MFFFNVEEVLLQFVGLHLTVLIESVCVCVFSLQGALESQVLDEKDKAQRLQTELDVSEQVQKDFVKLSQTLQVRNSFQFMDRIIEIRKIAILSATGYEVSCSLMSQLQTKLKKLTFVLLMFSSTLY